MQTLQAWVYIWVYIWGLRCGTNTNNVHELMFSYCIISLIKICKNMDFPPFSASRYIEFCPILYRSGPMFQILINLCPKYGDNFFYNISYFFNLSEILSHKLILIKKYTFRTGCQVVLKKSPSIAHSSLKDRIKRKTA